MFTQDVDFTSFDKITKREKYASAKSGKGESTSFQPIEYTITLDMAKELAMA